MCPWFLACGILCILFRCVNLAVLWESVVYEYVELAFWLYESVSTVPQTVCITLAADEVFRELYAMVRLAQPSAWSMSMATSLRPHLHESCAAVPPAP